MALPKHAQTQAMPAQVRLTSTGEIKQRPQAAVRPSRIQLHCRETASVLLLAGFAGFFSFSLPCQGRFLAKPCDAKVREARKPGHGRRAHYECPEQRWAR